MFKRLAVLLNVTLASSLAFSGCTVDAQLANSLLSSLQKSIASNTDSSTGQATLTAKDLATAADTAGVKVVCGGKDLSIASADDSEDSEDSSTLIQNADTIQPVLLSYGGQKVSRIQIDVNLQNDLQQLPKYQGQARESRYKQIQQKYPQMRNAVPVPVKGNGGREIVFSQVTTTVRQQTQAGRPGQQGFPGGPFPGGQQMGPGGQFPGHQQMGPGSQQGGPGYFDPHQQSGRTPAAAGQLTAHPIQGFTNAKGESCSLMAKDAATTDTSSSDTTDTSSSDTSSDSSAE